MTIDLAKLGVLSNMLAQAYEHGFVSVALRIEEQMCQICNGKHSEDPTIVEACKLLYEAGGRLPATKFYRRISGTGLKHAVDFINEAASRYGWAKGGIQYHLWVRIDNQWELAQDRGFDLISFMAMHDFNRGMVHKDNAEIFITNPVETAISAGMPCP